MGSSPSPLITTLLSLVGTHIVVKEICFWFAMISQDYIIEGSCDFIGGT